MAKDKDHLAQENLLKLVLKEVQRSGDQHGAIISALSLITQKLDLILDGIKPKFTIVNGGQLMFVEKADRPDVPYEITAPEVKDSEGNLVPDSQITYEVSSTDTSVVEVTPNPDDPKTGNVHFGSPGQASINVNAKVGSDLVQAFGAQFTLTAGDPASIVGGAINFPGLTEVPEA